MRTDIAILYATMTGNARECAEKTATVLRKAGLSARVHDLAHYDSRDLLQESTVLLAISTWGDGEPPDDGISFLITSKVLEKRTFVDCGLPSSRSVTRATKISVSAVGTSTGCLRNVAPADCLPALTMTSISKRRSLAGMKRSWWHFRTR